MVALKTNPIAPRVNDGPEKVAESEPSTSFVASFLEFERTNIMLPLQSAFKDNAVVATSAHLLGEACTGDGLVVLFAVLNWCVDTRFGTEGIWLVPVSEIANGLMKWTARAPRPVWVDDRLVQLGSSSSHEFSFPSSHAMISFSLATYFAAQLDAAWPFALASAVAASRVLEGMHYPHDVVAGGLFGAVLGNGLLAALSSGYWPAVHVRVAGGTALTVAALVLIETSYRSVKSVHVPKEWSSRVAAKLKGDELKPASTPRGLYVGMAGVLGGLTVGEAAFEPFPLSNSLPHAAARVAVGLVVLLSLFFGVRAAEKQTSGILALSLRFLRFAIVPPIILTLAPMLFAVLNV